MSFADALRTELGKDNHVGLLSSALIGDGVFSVDLSSEDVKLCVLSVSNSRCSIWHCLLSDKDIRDHVRLHL